MGMTAVSFVTETLMSADGGTTWSLVQRAQYRRRDRLAGTGAFFALSVADLAASERWYGAKLGLRPILRLPKSGKTAVVVLAGEGLIVELIQHDDATPLGKDPVLALGITKAGVIVDDYDRTLARLVAKNVEIAYGPWPARPGQRANVIVRDNSGNLIQLFGK
jgi:catechol 2,3-dioxygenase-like lactoylglutathione lyase family enzyme